MDDPQNILAAIYRAVDWINDGLSPDHQLVKATEQEIEDAFGVAVTLADERALSMKASPFRSIQSLADYIALLIKNADNG